MIELSLPVAFTGKRRMRCMYWKRLQRGREGRRMTGNQCRWKKREMMEMKHTVRKKAGSSSSSVDCLLLPPVRPGSSPFGCDFCCSATVHPSSCATHAANSTSAASQSVWPRSGSVTQILQIFLNTLRNSLISSPEHQFPAKQTHLTGKVSQYQQQGNTGKSFCTATSGQLVPSPN